MIKIELKTEFGAHEITSFDFEGPKRPEIRGVVWREETRTVRMASESEVQDGEDDPEDEDERPPRRRYPSNKDGSVHPLSFYGIGCFIIIKNGKAIGILGPKAFNLRYRTAE